MLRNPIKRFISEWQNNYVKFFKGQETWNTTLEDFMSCEYNLANNRQILLSDSNYDCSDKSGEEMLEEAKRNLESLRFFGLTEYHDLNQKLFIKTFSGSFRFLKEFKVKNQTKADEFYYDLKMNNSDKILYKIEELNSLDMQLYEFAKDLFFKRLKSQIVKIDEVLSDKCELDIGVPQGSILGPLFFIIFINDLPNYLEEILSKLFADDTTLMFSSNNFDPLNDNLKKGIERLNEWCKYNQLYIKWDKTKIMFITSMRINRVNSILFQNNEIEVVEKFKLLGMEDKPILTQASYVSTDSLSQRPGSPNIPIYEPCSFFSKIKKRHILTLYSFFGFFFAYIFRANLSVAIVEMSKSQSELTVQENNTLHLPLNEWSPLLQGYILSSFFYGYIITQIPAAYFSNYYGGKNLFGFGVGISAFLCLLMPGAAYLGPKMLMFLRILQGLSQGFIYPSMHCLWSKWCPPNERSRLATFALSGSYIGSVAALSLGGLISIYLNWQAIFYIFGVLGLVWAIFWFFNIYESPSEHVAITIDEKTYIESTLSFNDYTNIPWANILKSAPVWAITIAHFAENWGFYTMLTEMPTFLADILNFEIDTAGLLSALPYLIMAKVLYSSGYLSDKLIDRKMEYTKVRKIFCCFGFIAQAIFMFAMTLTYNPTLLIIFVTLSIGFGGMPWSAFGVNHLDIGAGYANAIMSITNTFATLAGIISPTLTGYLIEGKIKSEWNAVFIISAVVFLLGAFFYYILGTGDVQYWAIGSKEFENPSSIYSNDISRHSTFSISEIVVNDQEHNKNNK
ncbi:unnamed protein product [Brachionus calyciflorus]|uniref:Sialin n=1 Tax=Brachionus calyciflorus TaxID=104777 RepID=A0A813RZZ9_9BILA|nr:unnamed protein product [Brachionus calyciflorus]